MGLATQQKNNNVGVNIISSKEKAIHPETETGSATPHTHREPEQQAGVHQETHKHTQVAPQYAHTHSPSPITIDCHCQACNISSSIALHATSLLTAKHATFVLPLPSMQPPFCHCQACNFAAANANPNKIRRDMRTPPLSIHQEEKTKKKKKSGTHFKRDTPTGSLSHGTASQGTCLGAQPGEPLTRSPSRPTEHLA